ncbi:MAG: methyltransferase domain-containing protein [Chloroflexi bacterium]|nr:methyltransferase domain-containing protein [Chloroflexota bacterium]
MTIRDAYTRWSVTYDTDRNLTRDLDQIVTEQTLGSRTCTTILELGCGTGKNTALLADLGQQVIALDFSEGMIAQARAKLSADNVRFSLADLTQRWPVADHAVDLVVCNLVLEHIENLTFIFAEADRVLAQGGQFFISELHPFKQYQGAKATFDGEQIPAFVHHVSEFVNTAQIVGFALTSFREWWHNEDRDKLPRLVSFVFQKSATV